MSIITTSGHHGLDINDRISMMVSVPDRRWWRRLWFFLTFRRPPWRDELRYFKVTKVVSGTEVEINS